jgi:uncharacterized membrane protein
MDYLSTFLPDVITNAFIIVGITEVAKRVCKHFNTVIPYLIILSLVFGVGILLYWAPLSVKTIVASIALATIGYDKFVKRIEAETDKVAKTNKGANYGKHLDKDFRLNN